MRAIAISLLVVWALGCAPKEKPLDEQIAGTWELETLGHQPIESGDLQRWKITFRSAGTWHYEGRSVGAH